MVHLAKPEPGAEKVNQDAVNPIEFEGFEEIIMAGHSSAEKLVAAVADMITQKVKLILSQPPKARKGKYSSR